MLKSLAGRLLALKILAVVAGTAAAGGVAYAAVNGNLDTPNNHAAPIAQSKAAGSEDESSSASSSDESSSSGSSSASESDSESASGSESESESASGTP